MLQTRSDALQRILSKIKDSFWNPRVALLLKIHTSVFFPNVTGTLSLFKDPHQSILELIYVFKWLNTFYLIILTLEKALQ